MTAWRIVADETGTCNCAWGCPCQFNALPTYGRCEALVAVRIREGHYGSHPARRRHVRERRTGGRARFTKATASCSWRSTSAQHPSSGRRC